MDIDPPVLTPMVNNIDLSRLGSPPTRKNTTPARLPQRLSDHAGMTTFIMESGQYSFTRLPFDISLAK